MFKRGPVWWISFVYNGIRYRQSSGTGNKKLAQKIEDKVKGDIVQANGLKGCLEKKRRLEK
jgi:hypothetical protein